MKFTKEHLKILDQKINAIWEKCDKSKVIENYETGNFHNSHKVKNLQERFCFDLLFASRVKIGDGIGTKGDINGDYNDTHIFTALKVVCPKIEKRY